ncbi:hypothetical protein PInf_018533 [Phytophthora infestans]|nr:hypothetical protein PInf_018533 [Phytophthora infestans]
MNFVAIPTEDFDTVSEAIAFIDSFNVGLEQDTFQRNTSSSIHHHSDPPSASSDSDGQALIVKGVKRKGRGDPSGYSARKQQGKKAEIEALRRQVKELETHTSQLKRLRVSSEDEYGPLANDPTQSAWRKTVKVEYQERQRSEEINRKLKSIVSYQQKLDGALRHILGKKEFAQVCFSSSTGHADELLTPAYK